MEARKTREYIAWGTWQEVRHGARRGTRHGKKHGETRGMAWKKVKDVAMVMIHNSL